MGKRRPNKLGTGRFKLTKQRKTLGLMHIRLVMEQAAKNKSRKGAKKRKLNIVNRLPSNSDAVGFLGSWLKHYFCVDLDIVPTELFLKQSSKDKS
jgi:hypothetical protein